MSQKTSKKLTARQRRAITALATGESIAAAAALAGVSTRTIYRWRNDPAFAGALRVADADQIAMVARKLNTLSIKALEKLETLLDDPKTTAGVRARAIALTLQHRTAFYELTSFGDRLTAIEERLGL